MMREIGFLVGAGAQVAQPDDVEIRAAISGRRDTTPSAPWTMEPAVVDDAVSCWTRLYEVETLEHFTHGMASEIPGFLLVVLHDGAGNALVERGLLRVQLPGDLASSSAPVACRVDHVARRLWPKATIGELMPIVHLRAVEEGWGESRCGEGVAVLAQVIAGSEPPSGTLVSLDELATCSELAPLEREVVDRAIQLLASRVHVVPLGEIEAVAARPFRHWLHRALVRPLLARFSSTPLRRRVMAFCEDASTVLDVSCGDDRLIVELQRRGKECVANDVTLAQQRSLLDGPWRSPTLTLHNCVQLPFAHRFDIAVCKNTLHHLTAEDIQQLFAELRRVADRIVFVDIVDVKSWRRARLFNAYYRHVLGDQGHSFLTHEELDALVCDGFPDREVESSHIDTLKGRYALAHVNAKE